MNLRAPHHVYVHFPYCLYKCHYCDFNSFAIEAGKIPSDAYQRALLQEIKSRRTYFENSGLHSFPKGARIHSVFFGGGTPSLMVPQNLAEIISALAREYSLAPDCEITLEANPGTITKKLLSEFKQMGVTRLSLGVQSLADKNLKRFGRIHSVEEAWQALAEAQQVFADQLSCDLIYGFPEQSLAEWQNDLNRIAALGLKHISCYALTAESGTQFSADIKKQVYAEPNEDLLAEMFIATHAFWQSRGLAAYEISNFAEAGYESRHNLGYWNYESYVGLGAGACSNFVPETMKPSKADLASACGAVAGVGSKGMLSTPVEKDDDGEETQNDIVVRTVNHKVPETYMRTLADGGNFFIEEEINRRTAMSEFMMMGLRLAEGIASADFQKLFQDDWRRIFGPELKVRTRREDFIIAEGRLKVAPEVRLRLNQLLQAFV